MTRRPSPPLLFAAFALLSSGCASVTLDPTDIRPWQEGLSREYPSADGWIWSFRKGSHQLFYVAANHSNDPASLAHKDVSRLFRSTELDVLVIEPIAFGEGKSPAFYAEYVRKHAGKSDLIVGGEAVAAAALALAHDIPFFGGEPTAAQIRREMLARGHTDADIAGFYLIRQIPQWGREKENPEGLIERKGAPYLAEACKKLEIAPETCPSVPDVRAWYQKRANRPLSVGISTSELAPLHGSPYPLHRISSDIGDIRDRFTLAVIQKLLRKYDRVGVVYGMSHALTLRGALEAELGKPALL